jgi:multiple sugar transport system substrate-binding protein
MIQRMPQIRKAFLVRAALVTAATALGVSACSSSGNPGSNAKGGLITVSMSMAQIDKPSIKAISSLIALYNRTHPRIHVTLTVGVDAQKTGLQLAAGDAPDIIQFGSASDSIQYMQAGGLLPLGPFIKKTHFILSNFVPASVKQGEWHGKLYALTYLEDSYEVYYNPALFEAAGISHAPATLAQLVSDAKALTHFDSKGNIAQLGMGEGMLGADIPFFASLFGGSVVNEAGTQAAVDSPQYIRALDYVKQLFNAEGGFSKVDRFVSSFSTPNALVNRGLTIDAFASGKQAMELAGDYYSYNLAQIAPKLHYGLFLFPDVAPGIDQPGLTPLGGNPTAISKDSAHPDAAWNVLSWLETTGQTYAAHHDLLLSNFTATPNYIPVLKDPSLAGDPHYAWFWKEMLTNKHEMTMPNLANVDQYMTLELNEQDKFLRGQESASQAAANIAAAENADLRLLGIG